LSDASTAIPYPDDDWLLVASPPRYVEYTTPEPAALSAATKIELDADWKEFTMGKSGEDVLPIT
jgi:hypothetical protein